MPLRNLLALLLPLTFLLTSCTPAQPDHVDNICKIFRQYPKWYWYAQDAQKRWGIPIPTQLAIIHQESKFSAKAKPPREKLLWVIPWFRPSSAYGYAQALNGTWKRYQSETGRHGADRDTFADATDFVSWYANKAHQQAGISKYNTYGLYLAFHEGIGGYTRGTYKRKKWLIHVAQKVERRANTYRAQLHRCEGSLKKRSWWKIWQ